MSSSTSITHLLLVLIVTIGFGCGYGSDVFHHPSEFNLRVFKLSESDVFKDNRLDFLYFRWSIDLSLNNKTKDCILSLTCWNDTIEENSSNSQIFTIEVTDKIELMMPGERFENILTACQLKVTANNGNLCNAKSDILEFDLDSVSPEPIIRIASQNRFYEIDLDLKNEKTFNISDVSLFDYSRQGHKIFLVQNGTTLIQVENDLEDRAQLYETNCTILALTIDWIRMVLYWSQKEHDGSAIYRLNLNANQTSSPNFEKLLYVRKSIIQLKIDLWRQVLYGVPFHSEFDEPGICEFTVITNESPSYECFKLHQNEYSRETLTSFILSLFEKDLFLTHHADEIYAINVNSRSFKKFSYPGIQAICADGNYIYLSDKFHGITAMNDKGKIWKSNHNVPNNSYLMPLYEQNFPSINCLIFEENLMDKDDVSVELVKKTYSSLVLRLPLYTSNNCSVEVPGVQYLVSYWTNVSQPKILISDDRNIYLVNLEPMTEYSILVNLTNYYGRRHHQKTFTARVVKFLTPSIDTIPILWNFTVSPVSPTDVNVNWRIKSLGIHMDPIHYELHWKQELCKSCRKNLLIENVSNGSMLIRNLLPDSMYSIWFEAIQEDKVFNSSAQVQIRTLPHLGNLELVNVGNDYLEINWPLPSTIVRFILEYRMENSSKKFVAYDSLAGLLYKTYKVTGLQPDTAYHFTAQIFYDLNDIYDGYTWPGFNESVIFQTTGGIPLAPSRPNIVHIDKGTFNVSWIAPNTTTDKSILLYNLQGLQWRVGYRSKRSFLLELPEAEQPTMIENPIWSYQVFINGNQTFYIVHNLHAKNLSMFRVRAANMNGWGQFSSESQIISPPYVSTDKRSQLLAAIIFPILLIGGFLLIVYCTQYVRNRNSVLKVQTMLHNKFMECRQPLTMPSEMNVALLPKIDKADLTIYEILGRGSFGGIYEGVLASTNKPKLRVAIKTLTGGYDEQTKTELLQQGVLMYSFNHSNIINVIGVCLDVDFTTIVTEFMSHGNLLGYLRRCRPTSDNCQRIPTNDLISICADVASACRYLVEKSHFIIGNLSCRNCLVSVNDKGHHVVKIADLGFVKDPTKYKHDNNKDNVCLSIRWMSPQNLRGGSFCSQSDVWSFGVFCWEVFTFGENPYATKSNYEVIQFVKDGGTLHRPTAACNTLYNLMRQCWSSQPKDRPTFLEIDELFTEI